MLPVKHCVKTLLYIYLSNTKLPVVTHLAATVRLFSRESVCESNVEDR